MTLTYPRSLGRTLDAVNDALFFARTLTKADRLAAARWIARRQGMPGSYASMFAPTEADFASGIRVFTGERLSTRAGTAHILGEEAIRALILLDVSDRAVKAALARAQEGMNARLRDAEASGHQVGRYCCGICSAAYWRTLTVGGLENAEERLALGMRDLRQSRTGDGKWRPFPFWYTVLALSGVELPGASRELRHAAPVCERYLRRAAGGDAYAGRRRALAEQVLARLYRVSPKEVTATLG